MKTKQLFKNPLLIANNPENTITVTLSENGLSYFVGIDNKGKKSRIYPFKTEKAARNYFFNLTESNNLNVEVVD